MRLVNIVARCPGSTHDSRIFDNSRLRARLELGLESGDLDSSWLVGDGGYACRDYLLTTFRSPTTRAKMEYNLSHARTRNVIERVFGVWKNTFQVLRTGLTTKRETSMNIIVACAVLWNVRRSLNSYAEKKSMEFERPEDDSTEDYHSASVNCGGWSLRDIIVKD